MKRARISSDGGWFVDEFHVQEDANRKVSMGKDVWTKHTLTTGHMFTDFLSCCVVLLKSVVS